MRRRRTVSWKIAMIILFLVSVFCEEYYHATLWFLYKNYYRRTILRNITVERLKNQKSLSVAIISVLFDHSNYDQYRLAQESFECYALYHNYQWIVVDFSSNDTLHQLCPQHDFMFARHCVTAEILEENSNIDWFLFIDADMGVINPNHLIEEWIDESVSLIFYNRIFNHEIMAGSYLTKNNPYSRNFLRFWANYENKLPNSTHGSDNGAIHNVILELILPERIDERKFCESIWKKSKSFRDLSIYEACVRNIIGEAPNWSDKLRVIPKGKAWARDTWLTDSMWSEQDFILHGWQKRKLNVPMFAGWPSPFVSHSFNISLCTDGNVAALNWRYKDSFVRSNTEISNWLNKTISDSKYEYEKALKIVFSYRN